MFSQVLPMKNPIQYYEWGSRTAIPELLGIENPENKPMAELWMGAHPKAPSQVLVQKRWESLIDFIRKDPAAVLGRKVYERFGPELPFLLKVLAAQQPLSIQVHPNRSQARAGFLREERLGIPIDAPNRNYKDQNHKPELLCALTTFEAMKGFREPEKISSLLEKVLPSSCAHLLERLTASPQGRGIRDFFETLMKMGAQQLKALVGSVAEKARKLSAKEKEFQWVVMLHEKYPADPGVLSPLFLNLITLEPGEAIYLPAGELHAYLRGMGIEIMANSDNVVRGGLTTKHVDVEELLKVCKFAPTRVHKIKPETAGFGEQIYRTPAEEFQLSVIRIKGEVMSLGRAGREASSIIICTGGELRVSSESQGEPVKLGSGRSAFIPSLAHPVTLKGRGAAYKATVPFSS